MSKLNDNQEEIVVVSDQDYKEYLSKLYGKVYTQESLDEEYDVKSIAFGAILCARKGSEELVLINQIVSPIDGSVYFYIAGGF